MAEGDGDANSLRKQIEFLSRHEPNRKPVVKNQASLENLQGNKSSMKWKKEVVLNRNVTCSTKQFVKTASKDVLKSKPVLSCENLKRSLSPNKFTYRKTLDKNNSGSETGVSVMKSNQQIVFPVKKKDIVSEGMSSCASKCSVIFGKKNQPLHISKHTPKSASPNKYKLHRNNITKSTFPNSRTQLSSTRKQMIKTPLKKVHSSSSTGCETKSKTKNKSRQPRSNYQWSKKQKTSSNLCSVSKNDHRSRTIPKGSKLKWKRKSITHSGSTELNKTRPSENACRSKTIAKASKLKWRRRSATRSSSLTAKKSKQGRTQLVHKSRYSLKRISNNQKKISGALSAYSKFSCHWQQNANVQFGNSKLKNRSFVARRMKYVVNVSYTQQNNEHLPKLSNTITFKNAEPTRRAVRISGMSYIVGSDGKTLRKTETVKHKKTQLFKSRHVRLANFESRKSPNLVFNKKIVRKSLERQNSFEKHRSERANKILRRSIQNVQTSMKKDNRQKLKSQQYCMFYNKFGKCIKQKQGICPYIHDATKIAVCTRFLRGTCQQVDGTCPFSHQIDKEKMPICQYFLKGKCTRDDCPYSHVNVGRSAVLCEDFLRGYCALGFKCKKKHVLECEEFNATGQCPNGGKCKLIHRKKKRKRYFEEPITPSSEPVSKIKKVRRRSSDGFLPLEDCMQADNVNNSDLSTTKISNEDCQTNSGVTLQIRPKFAVKSSSDGCVLPRNETSSDERETN